MEKSPLVTIIIVSFNTKKLLLNCISSIEKWVAVSHQIVVVDNASSDGTVSALKSFKNVQVIANKSNEGFAKANNQGAQIARGKYLLLLNSDTYFIEDSVGGCLAKLQADQKIGIISCRLKNEDHTTQPTGGFFPTPLKLFAWMSFVDDLPLVPLLIKPFHPRDSFYKHNMNLDWITGAFFMVSKDLYQKLNGLDEDYFMYVEELDFCFRAQKIGYSVYYFHESSIVHLGRASSSNEFAITSEFKNILLFYKKHFKSLLWYATLVLRFGSILRILVFAILGKKQQKTIYEKIIATL